MIINREMALEEIFSTFKIKYEEHALITMRKKVIWKNSFL